MAVEGILFGSLTRAGASRVSAAAASAATLTSPRLDDGGPVSLRDDAFSVALGNRLAGRVRRHINWDKQWADLKEDLAHLVQDIKRRICGVASAGSPSFYV